MPETLQSQLIELRHRLKQMTWLYGLSWLVAVVFGATLIVGLLDWALHIEDPGLRLLFGLGILASAAWIAWRLLISPLRRQISDVEIALRIEKRFPGFNDSLASTVQFLGAKGNPAYGSPGMQQQVVQRTMEQARRVNLSDIVETRRVRKVAIWAVAICLIAATVAGWNQTAAATALHRLIFPFADRPWPKTTELQLVDEQFQPLRYDRAEPLRLAEGDTLEVYVQDLKDELPEDVRMEYQFGDEDVISEGLRQTTITDSNGESRKVCVASLVATKGPMAFRAVGGDDQEMRWQHLEVVPPPAIQTLNVTLTPPAYTGRPAEELPEGMGHVRGLLGTKVQIEARSNKPLQYANLRIKDESPVRAKLSENGQELKVEFAIAETGVYSWWFDLKDLQGFENPSAPRYEIRGQADEVPDVWIDEPPRDKNVTPTAMVPLLVGAKDDLGLKEIRLQYKLGEDDKAPLTSIPLFAGDDRPTERRVEYEWELADLNLQPGSLVTFHAEAVDDCDLNGEHIGRSIERKLTIVSPEEKSAELSARQGGLIEELENARSMQQQTHDQVEQLKIQLQEAGGFQFEDVDLLKRLEIEQRQVNSRLSHPQEGLTAHADDLLEELKQNKIDDPEMKQRLGGIAREIEILQEDHLPTIEQELTNARKFAETSHGLTPDEGPEKTPENRRSDSKDAQTALNKADGNQQAVLDSLDELLAQLSQWRHHRDLTGDVQDLIGNQEAINRDTGDVKRRTVGKRKQDLTPQDQADLARLADRQRKEARRVGDLGDRFEDLAEEMKSTSPGAAALLGDAAAHLREQAVAGTLEDAAERLMQNQIGAAAGQQREALEAMEELSDILKNRSVSDTETLVKKLKEARDELGELRQRQEELRKKIDEAKQIANEEKREQQLEELRQEQQKLRREVSSLARRLRRLQAPESGGSLRRAASRMEELERLIQEDQTDQLEQQEQEILDDLEQAERELAQEEQQAKERLAREMLEKISDELKSMIAREQNVIEETNRLEALKRERGGWNRAQLKSLRDLAEIQRHLQSETERLAEVVKAAEVFALALKGAVREMDRAADRLENRQTDGKTVARESSAKNRFVDLVQSLETEEDSESKPDENAGGGGSNKAGPQSDGIPHLAQLKMLKSLQEDLIRRTGELDRVREETGELSADQKQELDLLAGEQGLLADLTRNLTAEYAQAFDVETDEAEPKPEGDEPKPDEPKEAEKPDQDKPSLEDELNRDLDLDNLLPKSEEPEKPKDSNAVDGVSRFGRVSGRFHGFGFPAQVDVKEKSADEEPAEKTVPADKPDKPKPDSLPRVDESLIKELVGEDPQAADPTKNPLEDAITGMRSAQERITKNDTGEDTREIQQDVVANLQKLIDLARNNKNNPPKPPSSQSGSPQKPQDPDEQEKPKNEDPQSEPQGADQKPDPETEEKPQTGKQDRDDAEDSTDDEREGGDAEPNISQPTDMLDDVWGHLPPSVRDDLLRNLSSGKYPLKYEDMARRYFEALAEPADGSNRKSSE